MKWLSDNWSLLVVIVACAVVAIHYFKKFSGLPSEDQLKKVREYLLFVVITCEKEMGSGTGRAKLSMAYSMFIEHFPSLVPVIPFDLFCKLVDDALDEMRKLLETNKDIEFYVKGE